MPVPSTISDLSTTPASNSPSGSESPSSIDDYHRSLCAIVRQVYDDLNTTLATKAPLVSPALTGSPTAPTQSAGDNSTKIATTSYVVAAGQAGAYVSATAGGTADALTGIFSPTVTSITNGMALAVRAGSANATTTPTFSPDGLTAKTIVKGAGAALVAGDIAGAGHWIVLRYDQVLDKWVMQNPATGVTAQALASNAETQAGALDTKAVTPASLAATMLGGVGQTRQNVTGSRAASTVYTNSTGRPIVIALSVNVGPGQSSTLTVGSHVINIGNAATVTTTVVREVLVLPGETYSLTLSGSSIASWWEIR